MPRLITVFSIIVLFLCLSLNLNCKKRDAPEHLFRASLLTNENHTWFKALEHFGELLKKRSNGRMELEVYHSEQLAKEMEAIRMIETGVIEMTIIGSTMTNWVEIAAFCEMPYLIETEEQQEYLVNGPLGERIKKELREKTNLLPIMRFDRSPRHLTSNRPIKHPDDLNGIILRVPSVPIFVTAWSAMGAKPTPMAFSEVFTSLQQGTIEALENPVDMILNGGFAEVQQYVNLTGHVRSWCYVVVGKEQLQALPEDLREIFLETASEIHEYEKDLRLDAARQMERTLKEKGMQFVEVDQTAFAEKCKHAVYESLSPQMKEVYQEVEEAKKKLSKP